MFEFSKQIPVYFSKETTKSAYYDFLSWISDLKQKQKGKTETKGRIWPQTLNPIILEYV